MFKELQIFFIRNLKNSLLLFRFFVSLATLNIKCLFTKIKNEFRRIAGSKLKMEKI